MKDAFWAIFAADIIFSLGSMALAVVVALLINKYRKKKMKKEMAKIKKIEGPRVIVVGGKSAEPSHCPLCGRDWPLPGPIDIMDEEKKEEAKT